jgi:hypothetical protein
MRKIILSTLLFSSIFVFNNCKPGDQGDAGAPGPQGLQGVPGPAGPAGAIGAANVIYSNWIETTFTGSNFVYSAIIPAAKLTQDILDRGSIKVYWKQPETVISLPSVTVTSQRTFVVSDEYAVGKIFINANYLLPVSKFRYVIIPGGVASGRKANVDLNNYDSVKIAYNLPD